MLSYGQALLETGDVTVPIRPRLCAWPGILGLLGFTSLCRRFAVGISMYWEKIIVDGLFRLIPWRLVFYALAVIAERCFESRFRVHQDQVLRVHG